MTTRARRRVQLFGGVAVIAFAVAACHPFHQWGVNGAQREWYCDPTDVALNDSHHHDPDWAAYYTEEKGPLNARDCHDVDEHLTAATEFALQYPTVADAEAAGFWWAADWVDGQGYHYTDLEALEALAGGVTFDPDRPQWLQYDANGTLVGMMFHQSGSASQPPAESLTFPGANDHWHRHAWLCIDLDGTPPIISDFHMNNAQTQAACAAQGGDGLFSGATEWMVHIWITPYDDGSQTWTTLPDVFDDSHPALFTNP